MTCTSSHHVFRRAHAISRALEAELSLYASLRSSVVRAVEEAGGSISVYSPCSGGALFVFPLAAGLSSREAADLVMGLEPGVHRRLLARALPSLGRRWAGFLRGDKADADIVVIGTPAFRLRYDLDVLPHSPSLLDVLEPVLT